MTVKHDDPRFTLGGGEWMQPYLDQANKMIEQIALAQAGKRAPISEEELSKWKSELVAFCDESDSDFEAFIASASYAPHLVVLAGRIIARRSIDRLKGKIKSYRTPDMKCPTCGDDLGGATSTKPDGGPPSIGDVSVCFNCGEILTFGPNDTMQIVGLDETLSWPDGVRRLIFRMQGQIHRRGRLR
jgi:hypothetical protein